MSIRDADIDNLIVKLSAYFSDKVLKGVADPVDLTDAVNLQTLNAAVIAGGWDSVTFNTSTGDLKFFIAAVLDFTVNLDNRYTTAAEVLALIGAASKANFTITLASGGASGDIQTRINGATEIPPGWTLTADGLNLDIEHNLGRYAMLVTVFATSTSPANQKLNGTAAENGIVNVDTNNVKILSLATIQKEIYIFISFVQ